MNVSTLSMMWFHRPPHPFLPPPHSEKLIPDFVVAELKLNSAQKLAFDESQEQQMRKITPLLDSLHQYKQQLFLSAFNTGIDTARMIASTKQIGNIAEKIDIITFYHVIELKRICNPQQQELLEDMFRDIGKIHRRIEESDKSHQKP